MKQIILKNPPLADGAGRICTGRLMMLWGLYGVAVAFLWRAVGSNVWAQAAVWAVALLAALALLIQMAEV